MNLFEENQDLSQIKIPSHIAIIMDGNYRWAKKNNLPLKIGHKKGTENIEKVVDGAIEKGVKFLTIYAFSSENWDRPKDEVDYLLKLLDQYLSKDINSLIKKQIKILISGNLDRLPEKTREKIAKIEEKTKNNTKFTLNVAFSYGARQEIVDMTKKIALAVKNDEVKIENINEDLIAKNLYQPEIPDPDLLIRTAGDYRISNFLLYQMAYTEFYFTSVLWPDFSQEDLNKALIDFNKRKRKYGKR